MSRSQPTLQNPAEHFFEWSGSKGNLEWYDKEKQKRIPVKLPFTFMVLDELSTITGFSEQDSSRYWSNEVRSVAREELTVKTGKGTKAVGFYKDLTDVRAKGAKYAKSIYIAHKGPGGEYIIGNIKASGAALTAWIELSQKHKVSNGTVMLTGSEEATKGATHYHVPTFEYRSSTDEENAVAIELDKQLQVFLSQYLSERAETHREDEDSIIVDEIDQSVGTATDEQIADFESRKSKAGIKKPTDEDAEFNSMIEAGYRADDIDLNDIPF